VRQEIVADQRCPVDAVPSPPKAAFHATTGLLAMSAASSLGGRGSLFCIDRSAPSAASGRMVAHDKY
jgi:hypothetical protein